MEGQLSRGAGEGPKAAADCVLVVVVGDVVVKEGESVGIELVMIAADTVVGEILKPEMGRDDDDLDVVESVSLIDHVAGYELALFLLCRPLTCSQTAAYPSSNGSGEQDG